MFLKETETPYSFFDRNESGHLDLPRARAGGFAGGLFAIMVPPEMPTESLTEKACFSTPDFPELNRNRGADAALKMMAGLQHIADSSNNALQVVRTVDDLERCMSRDIIAASIHFEGAEPVSPDLENLQMFYDAGLRSLGIVWSRPNAFGSGVPIRFPASPDIGPGLTDAGKQLVRDCNRMGILIDLSHLNEKGFRDVEKISNHPLTASHSNAHALCPSSRNLTDDQLQAIAGSRGIVGINFAVAFLRKDGLLNADTAISVIVDHFRYIADKIGVDHVGFGSDFNGALIPEPLKDAAGLPQVIEALRHDGFSESDLKKMCSENWIRVLKATWG